MARRWWRYGSLAASLVVLGATMTAARADGGTALYACTMGATIGVQGGVVSIKGQGSCLDANGRLHSMGFSGQGNGGAATCLPAVPVIQLPAMDVSLDLADQYGLTSQTIAQRWSELVGSPGLTGAPVYAAVVHEGGQVAGVVSGLSISAAACSNPVATQGPFTITFSD